MMSSPDLRYLTKPHKMFHMPTKKKLTLNYYSSAVTGFSLLVTDSWICSHISKYRRKNAHWSLGFVIQKLIKPTFPTFPWPTCSNFHILSLTLSCSRCERTKTDIPAIPLQTNVLSSPTNLQNSDIFQSQVPKHRPYTCITLSRLTNL